MMVYLDMVPSRHAHPGQAASRMTRNGHDMPLHPTDTLPLLLGSVSNEYSTARDQEDAEPIWQRQPFAQKEDCKNCHEDDAELVQRSNAPGISELQSAEIANPRSACRGTR